eukprot:TRINITY_DN39931_c0_g1_i3.p1 TRINITY_DN39931_c0_g1~~TRINITY_DN39931_c0_g1_i3.p1  ORF type:complete len:158 (+),score=4.15 TRINITY_DN39931_c0_g1_i3:61-474(+)
MIKKEETIQGIRIGNVEHKISQFADDTQLLNVGDKVSFERTIHTIDHFGKISGLYMNSGKTQAIWSVSKKRSHNIYYPYSKMIWNPSKFKILGIWFTQDLADCKAINYSDRFSELKVNRLLVEQIVTKKERRRKRDY